MRLYHVENGVFGSAQAERQSWGQGSATRDETLVRTASSNAGSSLIRGDCASVEHTRQGQTIVYVAS